MSITGICLVHTTSVDNKLSTISIDSNYKMDFLRSVELHELLVNCFYNIAVDTNNVDS